VIKTFARVCLGEDIGARLTSIGPSCHSRFYCFRMAVPASACALAQSTPEFWFLARIDSRFFGFFDSRIFGGLRQINELSDSHLIGPDTVCGHFENDSIPALRTTRFRFENDSISDPTDMTDEFRLDFFARFFARKNRGGSFLP
jgi:hypothetical protein